MSFPCTGGSNAHGKMIMSLDSRVRGNDGKWGIESVRFINSSCLIRFSIYAIRYSLLICIFEWERLAERLNSLVHPRDYLGFGDDTCAHRRILLYEHI